MGNIKKTMLCVCALLIQLITIAQTTAAGAAADENKDLMRTNGKIYVVMVVVITILAGLIIYVFSLDRKITKLEKGT